MAAAARLAEEFPETTFILQHAGMLEDLSDEGRAAWRQGMAELAERPNVVAKLSGLGTFIHRNDPGHIAWVVDETVALFGTRRCLFGSQLPDREAVDRLRLARQPRTGRRSPSPSRRRAGDAPRRRRARLPAPLSRRPPTDLGVHGRRLCSIGEQAFSAE